jgi:hypothetical protein
VPVKKHSVAQIIAKLREIEKLTAQGCEAQAQIEWPSFNAAHVGNWWRRVMY